MEKDLYTHTHIHTRVHYHNNCFLQTRFSMELNQKTLDADIERSFKVIHEEFDAVGHHW